MTSHPHQLSWTTSQPRSISLLNDCGTSINLWSVFCILFFFTGGNCKSTSAEKPELSGDFRFYRFCDRDTESRN